MSKQMSFSDEMQSVMNRSFEIASDYRHEFITPEHLLLAICDEMPFISAMESANGDIKRMKRALRKYIKDMERVPDKIVDFAITQSVYLEHIINGACHNAASAENSTVQIEHIIVAIFATTDLYACTVLNEASNCNGDKARIADFIADLMFFRGEMEDTYSTPADNDDDQQPDYDDEFPEILSTDGPREREQWQDFATCINDHIKEHNPLIGRNDELDRTIQVLCRKEKNNVLHIGDPGVGKSALIYGLAKRIESGDVPYRLAGYKIYQIDMGDMVAGTQYRGDFEKRLKMIMRGLLKEGKAIIYIDEIHNIVGAGATGNSSLDASNLLKPYLENGDLRFIGATTFDEFKRSLANSRGIMRHFQQVEILEPSADEAVDIILGLRKKYENFHGVKYPKDVITFAVKSSARYINNRALPDKALDLIDEAGAYLEMNPDLSMKVDKELISKILARICKVDHLAELSANEDEHLDTLYTRISSKIFGQDDAIKSVVEAVQMSRAGLLDENKPTASLLFVGPTGVGKTEVARVLSHELGLNLVRFDMSEYAEKHTVAKLIGSPAGYVGYEDGGLLTDAIRKTPNCVLLLDEIEKAHSDIYNILLQVMDYASLTDNRGQKADFRHVILIMTSNAGAQHAGKASVGFTGTARRGDAMMKCVKATFKPEFLNRLSGTVVFNDLNRQMASLILEKKLSELRDKLTARKITLILHDDATNWLLEKGFTPEYGAREIDRVINQSLKPKLMREILFGSLKKSGVANVAVSNGELALTITKNKRN